MKSDQLRPRVPFRQWALLWCGLLLLPIAPLLRAQSSEWHEKMQPIAPEKYVCRHAPEAPNVDGNLDDPAWRAAAWTGDFVDIQGNAKPTPSLRTRAKMLWDEQYLYIAAELEEPHIWGTLTNHDAVIFHDPDFEVFIDPRGETQPYYEFEINALNTTWDLRLNKPYQDQGKAENAWEIPGAKTAVQIRGTLNNPADTDECWTIELAFPWAILSRDARHSGPPREGEQWRINFSRVEWQVTVTNGGYQKLPNTPEDNWVWSPQGVVDMHRPEMWGVVQFTRRAREETVPVADIPGKPARDAALEVYYAQRDFWNRHRRWTTNRADLNLTSNHLSRAEPPMIEATADGYTCSVFFTESGQRRVWRVRQDRCLKLDEPLPVETESFVAHAAERFGDAGRRAAYFLVDNMPSSDRAFLSREFLMENLTLAFEARRKFPWATNLAERLFLNDVLPYASLDEPRDPWRAEFFQLASEIVRDCKSASEAAQALNRDLFNRINVHYNLRRKRNNQSPKESIEQGRATCTGLSILLVDACRAVGIPARIAGVAEWVHKDGNHTWVEIWDDGWHFTGADEYNREGLNRGWFNSDTARTARSTNRLNQIFATSWRRTGEHFPLAWDSDSRDVAAVNVSAHYAALERATNSTGMVLNVRLRETTGGERLRASVELRDAHGALISTNFTRAGTADLNDMPAFTLPANSSLVTLRFQHDAEFREKLISSSVCFASTTLDIAWDELTPVPPEVLATEFWLGRPAAERGTEPNIELSKPTTERIVSLVWEDVRRRRIESAEAELHAKKITIGDKTLKWLERSFGEAPDGKHSLWITLHGGGQGTEASNDANWKGYFGRYEFPPGSINVAPRAPADTWDMWHVNWVDALFNRLIANYVLQRNVDPNRVYLIGYSAGGDGVYQLAPRLSDRFAAAAMCAGHPNEITPDGLRNLPFFLYMGGDDSPYNRNVVVREFNARLDALQSNDPDGYPHRLTVFDGLPHNMQGREAEMIPRMSPLRRSPWPKRVVWKQDDNALHTRLYWLSREAKDVKPGEIFAARAEGQTIVIESPPGGSLTLRLSDALLDLDAPIRVIAGSKTIFEGRVKRALSAVVQSLQEREDLDTVATAILPVNW